MATEVEQAKDTALVPRKISKMFMADTQPEGMGARVRRSIGTNQVKHFTPFLVLDHLVKTGEGFPDHPHRGQETITYVLQGYVDHEDFTGSSGTIGPGDLQFMTAGRGIEHAEMPRKDEKGRSPEIMQLWVDLPRNLKGAKPRYRDLRAKNIPVANPDDKVEIKVISGESYGVTSVQDLAYTPVVYYDCRVQPGGEVSQPIPEGYNVFLYLLNGSVTINKKEIPEHYCVLFNHMGNSVKVSVDENKKKEARFIIVGGKMLDQPIVQHGPFVEVSNDRIAKAFKDYQNRKNGFERSKGWKSKIGGM